MLIRINDYVHLGIFAPAGSGKGTSYVIPVFRSFPGSVVTIDVKGENYRETAEIRQLRFSHRTVRIDPYGGSGDGLNPLFHHHPKSPLLLDKCRDIAGWMIFRKGTEPDPHWNDNAENVWGVFTYYVATCETNPARRNLLSVRAIVQSRDAYMASLNVMRQHGGMLKQQADSLSWIQDKELNSVLSTLQRQTSWMDSPQVANCLKRSTFDPVDLRGGKLDVFLTVPPERLERMAGLLRLSLGTLIDSLLSTGTDESRQVLFLVDEAAHIGKMQILEDAITLMRGYGIRVWLFFQSLGQLQKCYGDNASTVLDNLNTQIYFGISNSFDTAEAISKRIGDRTLTQYSVNDTIGYSHATGLMKQTENANTSSSLSITTSEMARRWAKAEEIMTLPADLALVFHRNMPVLPIKLCKFYEHKAFRNGGTGDDSGLGLAAGVMAVLLLAASFLFSAMVACLMPPASPQLRPAAAPTAGQARRPVSPLPLRRPAARSRNRRPSGFLIPIR